jgi:hypothetical protein
MDAKGRVFEQEDRFLPFQIVLFRQSKIERNLTGGDEEHEDQTIA